MPRIIYATDLHDNLKHWEFLEEASNYFDATFYGGDHIGPIHGNDTIAEQKQIVDRTWWLAGWAGNYFGVTGNHDITEIEKLRNWHSDLSIFPHLRVNGREHEFMGLAVDLVDYMNEGYATGRTSVCIEHVPPEHSDCAISRYGIDQGDLMLHQRLQAGAGPRLLLCGHQHEPRKTWCRVGVTTVINPGTSHANAHHPHWVDLHLDAGKPWKAFIHAGGRVEEIAIN
jgi:Icc-related predicted phosphoesterase